MTDSLKKLNEMNEAQQRAVHDHSGHLLIVAGPGTGKTHTLTHRIAKLYSQIKPGQSVLAITFTNKAADELKERLGKLKFPSGDQLFIGTFHSFCLSLLREHASFLSLSEDFQLVSPEEIEGLVKEIWPQKSPRERREVLENISRYKANVPNAVEPVPFQEYQALLRGRQVLDYDDLLWEAVKLLNQNEIVLNKLHQKYCYIFVDEYQDINPIQHEFLKLLVQDNVTLTAIGDPNQAIYGFRGSDVSFFKSFDQDFKPAVRLSLSENYRSTANILEASGQVISKGEFFVPELTANIYAEGRLVIHEASTDKGEAEYVVHQIEKMVGGTSMFSQDSGRVERDRQAERSFGDIAVLYRLNALRGSLEKALERSGIPFQVSGQKPYACEDVFVRQAERVNLMTIHAAKGLEFPVVFMIGCEESLLPLNLEGMTSDLQEERRLFYVGMTRAKETLYLLRAKKRLLFGKFYQNLASRFLSDIKEGLKNYEHLQHDRNRVKEKIEKQYNLF